ncbi:MAG: hypothetical protein HYS17_01705 [Micavibrio aeruginosavorus]|uniref:Uncharacterized protein n=1 Tax=Micavibrio aeruginosavorus TaxID=349221 RepID=A0A7T5UI14_9BACT|nr:MAG: hypothetical protein HYS17_01705 [Micavibrio aeruginosavorus]
MNETVYHHIDITIDSGLPTPGVKDVAEVFGASARQMDHEFGVKPISPSQGVYRVGATGAGAQQIKSGPQGHNAHVSPDFYLR